MDFESGEVGSLDFVEILGVGDCLVGSFTMFGGM